MSGNRHNLTIVRMGSIAMMPGEAVPNVKIFDEVGEMNAYLVKARSTGQLAAHQCM